MPINIACPKCNAKYQVPSKFQGKAVKCQKCNTSFKATAKPATATRQRKTSGAESNVPSQEFQKLGIDGPIASDAPDIFDSPPATNQAANMLGNHALDPGFSTPSTSTSNEPEPELGDLFINPALGQQKPKKKVPAGTGTGKRKKKEAEQKKLTKQIWFLILITLGPLTLLCSIPAMIFGSFMVIPAFVGFGICSLVSFAVSIWGLALAHEATGDSTTIILCLLVPFYMLYIIIAYWKEMLPFILATVVITALQMSYIVTFVIAGAF